MNEQAFHFFYNLANKYWLLNWFFIFIAQYLPYLLVIFFIGLIFWGTLLGQLGSILVKLGYFWTILVPFLGILGGFTKFEFRLIVRTKVQFLQFITIMLSLLPE